MKKPMWRSAARAVLYTGAAIAGTVVGTSVLVGWTIVRPSRDRRYDAVPRIRFGTLEPIDLMTSDGLRLHTWVLLSRAAAANKWVLVLHGYRSRRDVLQTRARYFSRRGFHVLLPHLRGHGSSEPARISYGYNERNDVQAAFDFIRSLRPNEPVSIGIDGISMGAAAAAYAVGFEQMRPDWMILESCYDTIRHALANRLAMRIGRPLTPLLAWPVEMVVEQLAQLRAADLDPGKALENARCPILVLGGDSEKVLKTVEIEYLYGAIGGPKRLALFPGAGHEDLLMHDPKRYIRAVDGFLRDFTGWKAPHSFPYRGTDGARHPVLPSP